MVQGVGNNAAMAATQVVNSPGTNTGVAGGGLSQQKDLKESSTAPQFGELWKQIQTKYGAKPEKPKEIKKTLGKDDFLKIMITQMKNQDPTSPFKAEQFATELAQFTSVEQLQNMNQSLNKMATQNQPLERMAMTNLIGKTVTVDRERFPHTEGQGDSLSFSLPRDAATVHVSVVAMSGESILEKDLGDMKAGAHSFEWDGLKGNTVPAKNGEYMLKVSAKDEKDQSITTNPRSKTKVVGVSFDGGEPVFLVGDINKPDKVSMRNVVRIEESQELIPGAKSYAAAGIQGLQPQNGQMPQEAPQSQPNLIAFQKGIGSSNMDQSALPPEAAEALARLQMGRQPQQQQDEQPKAEPQKVSNNRPMTADNEKGFPNGLGDANRNNNITMRGGEN
jgi:flagellar basal-body rod modification protein FlgD